ncbi:MAG: hypothetical protein Q9167_003809 [Letrouitia subvulpina]
MKGPGLKPPTGVVPNFVNPFSRQDYGFLELGLCLGLSTVLIGVRAYTKLAIVKSVGREDCILFLTWLVFVAYCTLGFLAMRYGGGMHQWDVRLAHVVKFGQVANAIEVIACFLNLIVKIAILLQYLHLFVPTQNRIYYLVHFFMWFNGLFDVALALVLFFQCKPRRKIWMGDLVPGKCVNFGATLISAGIINAFTDFLVLGLPLFTVWRLQLPMKKKVGISAIFALGLLHTTEAIARPPPVVPALYRIPSFSSIGLHQGKLAHEYSTYQEVEFGLQGHIIDKDSAAG